jgi:hypothetical protein
MNPNMLNRRSILTGGTLISLSTLLAACVPHDITTAGDESTASGKPATNSSPSSSSGNNASSGEYRKADAKGPAQNVPKPNAPENGYRDKTPDGILKTMDAWNQWINYGVQTGDYSKAREFLSTSNDGELKIYREIEALYQRGGWVIDGIEHFEPEGIPRTDDHQTYYLKTNHEWDNHTEVEPDGRQETWSSDKEEEIYKFALEHRDGRWQILYSQIDA